MTLRSAKPIWLVMNGIDCILIKRQSENNIQANVTHIRRKNVNNEKLTEPFANVTQSEFQEYCFNFCTPVKSIG